MTKNEINLPNMTEQNLVEDIFNFNPKRKKIDCNIDTAKRSMTELDETKFGNNNHVKYIDKDEPQNLKRKPEDEYDLGKIVESNMIIDKNDTIRLELRQPVNGEYKRTINDEGQLEDSNDYVIKNGIENDGKEPSNGVEYINEAENQENVSKYLNIDDKILNNIPTSSLQKTVVI